MWRFCDLHNHTLPNDQCRDEWDAEGFVQSCLAVGLQVVGVTDHDHCERVADVAAAAPDDLVVVPGVEISTDRGHVLALAPGDDGLDVIRYLITRVGAAPDHQVELDDLISALRARRGGGGSYAENVVLIGAHVDVPGSLLSSSNTMSIERQLDIAAQLHALEVVDDRVLSEWTSSGVKQGPKRTLLQGSDTHDSKARVKKGTWIYLPEVTAEHLRHALAVPEASVCLDDPPSPPEYVIESVEFTGGLHDGQRFDFCERSNALIGSPNSGKSFLVDALKFVFGIRCDLPDVEEVSARRMASCLPEGATVEVRLRTPTSIVPISRSAGSARPPAAPFLPIIFSQTELTRRAMAPSPAISLLDIHHPAVEEPKKILSEVTEDVVGLFTGLLDDARTARELRTSIENPQDGLEATAKDLQQLAGTEEIAQLAVGVNTVEDWRSRVRGAIEEWGSETAPASPELPQVPSAAASGTKLARFAPIERIQEILGEHVEGVSALIKQAANRMAQSLNASEADLAAVREDVTTKLAAAGFGQGTEVEARLAELRDRMSDLEREKQELEAIEEDIDTRLNDLRELHSKVVEAREALTDARKDACRAINRSMRSFFCKIDEKGETAHLDSLIEDLKTGTWMRAPTRQDLRERLDRFRLLEAAVRRTQGRETELEGGQMEQDRVVDEVLTRQREADLARLACLWPGDSLVLTCRSDPPTPFESLTEGLRALAIKEISFADSRLPVVTDQPEDAVPTRAVFENLVPTLREQRAQRQFLVVSHDANVVVASDVERIWVLKGEQDEPPYAGSLFDSRVREAALEHLEGGQDAFRLRAKRYQQLGEES